MIRGRDQERGHIFPIFRPGNGEKVIMDIGVLLRRGPDKKLEHPLRPRFLNNFFNASFNEILQVFRENNQEVE